LKKLRRRKLRLGFAIAYQRPEEKFIYQERAEGAQIMLSQRSGKWETELLDRPYGRGTMFQVYVTSIEPVQRSLEAAGWPLYAGPREVWRKVGDCQSGQREIFVLDPDGYLVMVAHDLGYRSALSEPEPVTIRPAEPRDLLNLRRAIVELQDYESGLHTSEVVVANSGRTKLPRLAGQRRVSGSGFERNGYNPVEHLHYGR
jgi:hypothetical protein